MMRHPWYQDGCFEYHKPYELKKMGDNFFMDFSFFTQRFFKENIWNFFHNAVCGTMCKVKKEENLFFRDSQLPSQIARTSVRLLYRNGFVNFSTQKSICFSKINTNVIEDFLAVEKSRKSIGMCLIGHLVVLKICNPLNIWKF